MIIYKYKLMKHPGTSILLNVPIGFEFLDIQIQDSFIPIMWLMVDRDKPKEDIQLLCMYTGLELPIDNNLRVIKYLKTIQINGIVLHYFLVTHNR